MSQRIPRDQARRFAFDCEDEPLLTVQPGERFEVETDDAGSGYFKSERDLAIPSHRPGFDRSPPLANPIAGPIAIDGARRGDSIAVTIEAIEVGDRSWTAVGPKRGPLGESSRWPELSSEYTTKIFRHEPGPSGTTKDGALRFNERIAWPITPFIGTIGVAPDREVTTSADGQGDWGGNLDIRDVAPGNTVVLPVYHRGAKLYVGDVHASQGDTEFTGTAAEARATLTLKVEVLHNVRVPFMRIEKPASVVSVYCGRPMEYAVEQATILLMDRLIREHGYTPTDAYCLVGTCPDFRINVYQSCRIGKLDPVVGAELPRRYLFDGSTKK